MKSLVSVVLLILAFNFSFAQSMFDINTVHKVEINFFAPNWDHLLDSLASEESGTGSGTGRILANVIINGTELDSCGVRYKGNSSMDTTSNKNPFNIDLNYVVADQEYQGKDKVKLANCFSDPSMLREALTYELANSYMDAPKASFVQLFINGEFRGIYTNTESVDNEFLTEHYGSEDNSFFKCDPTSFELYGDNSNLAYHSDTMVYDTLYDMKSDFGLEELQALSYQLENEPATIGDYLDVDRALWFLALSNLYVHNDGYTAFGHNYYVYKMDNGKWSIVLWDVNMSFGGLLWNGENFLPLGFDGLVEQDPFLHEVAYDFRPLIAHLLSNPKYKRMYVAHYKTMLTETISNDYYMERAEAMHDLISPYVETEPYPHYDFEDFNANITDDVGFWFDFRPGIASLMEERDAYINTLPEFMYLQPTILPVTVTPIAPEAYTTVTFTTEVTDANLVEFNYRFNEFDYFVTQPMFDDGAHGDGASGDGVYGVEIAILASDMEYYIYAENELAAKFAPVRAAHEFFTLIPKKGLVINELSADNESIITDEEGDYEDWIELFNNSEETISLGGYYLSDNASNLSKWTFPEVSIAAGEYLIVWADNDTIITDGLHANFKLSSAGEVLTLSNSEEQILDQISFTTQYEDITFGRFENGTGSFDYLYPTFAAENSAPVSLQEEEIVELSAYPNPANNQVTVTYSTNQNTILRLYSVSGRLVLEQSISDQSKVMLDISNLQAGLYILTDTKGRLFKLMVE